MPSCGPVAPGGRACLGWGLGAQGMGWAVVLEAGVLAEHYLQPGASGGCVLVARSPWCPLLPCSEASLRCLQFKHMLTFLHFPVHLKLGKFLGGSRQNPSVEDKAAAPSTAVAAPWLF